MAPMHLSSSFPSPQLGLPTAHQNQQQSFRTGRRNTQLTYVHSPGAPLSMGGGSGSNININYNCNNNIKSLGGGGLGGSDGGGGLGGGGGEGDNGGGASDTNYEAARFVLEQAGRDLKSLPDDLVVAIGAGRVTADILLRFLKIDDSPLLRGLLQFRGFSERLLADDLFLAKLAIPCLVGAITKIAAMYENTRENPSKEIDNVTTSLVAFIISSYLLVQRLQAIVKIGARLFEPSPSLAVTGATATDAPVIARKTAVKELDDKVEEIPEVPTPDKGVEKWWSRLEAGAEIINHSSIHGGRFRPATMTKV